MLASIESFFIFLLIAGASALVNWMKKRGENSSDWKDVENPPPARSTPPPRTTSVPPASLPKQTTSWEEELRRMLEGTVPTTQTPTPPPIVVQERKPVSAAPRQPTPPPVEERPRMSLPKAFEEKHYKAHCNYCEGHIEFPASAMEEVVPCPHCHRPTVLRPFENTRVEVLAHQNVMADFQSTERTYEQASQLSQRVAAHMHGAGHVPVPMTSIEPRKTLWPEVAETRALFKNGKTARQAMIASLIFGAPKALED